MTGYDRGVKEKNIKGESNGKNIRNTYGWQCTYRPCMVVVLAGGYRNQGHVPLSPCQDGGIPICFHRFALPKTRGEENELDVEGTRKRRRKVGNSRWWRHSPPQYTLGRIFRTSPGEPGFKESSGSHVGWL